MTIIDAIKCVLKEYPRGLSSTEVFQEITDRKLYEFGAANPASVVNGMIRRHCQGLEFPSASIAKFFSIIGYRGGKPLYTILEYKDKTNINIVIDAGESDNLPEEVMQKAYEKHLLVLRDSLKQAILDNCPQFFEQLVVDLLLAMGYGYDKASGIVVGGVHDGGIDGIIYEDKLGLDRIYLQAKRYNNENHIGRKELQAFVGAMQSVQKGVFITTSFFTKEATIYAQNQQQKSLKLIDGDMLADLMIKHEVGVIPAAKPFVVYKLDGSYFG